jgi:hypothetical protein
MAIASALTLVSWVVLPFVSIWTRSDGPLMLLMAYTTSPFLSGTASAMLPRSVRRVILPFRAMRYSGVSKTSCAVKRRLLLFAAHASEATERSHVSVSAVILPLFRSISLMTSLSASYVARAIDVHASHLPSGDAAGVVSIPALSAERLTGVGFCRAER